MTSVEIEQLRVEEVRRMRYVTLICPACLEEVATVSREELGRLSELPDHACTMDDESEAA